MKRLLIVSVIAVIFGTASAGLFSSSPATASGGEDSPCLTRFDTRREIATARFMKRPWVLEFYRDKRRRPCLADQWHKYGSLFPFEVRDGHPRLGMLDLASTEAPGDGPGAYVMVGYLSERVAKVTFRLDHTTDVVEIVRPPGWTRLRKDLFIHFIKGGRFDRDRSGRLRLFDERAKMIRTKVLHRRDFFLEAEAL